MDFKKQYRELVQRIKFGLSAASQPSRNEDIANTLGYNRSYFSQILAGDKPVNADHINQLKVYYKDLLEDTQPAYHKAVAPGVPQVLRLDPGWEIKNPAVGRVDCALITLLSGIF